MVSTSKWPFEMKDCSGSETAGITRPVLVTRNLELPPTCASMRFWAPDPTAVWVRLMSRSVAAAVEVWLYVGRMETALLEPEDWVWVLLARATAVVPALE